MVGVTFDERLAAWARGAQALALLAAVHEQGWTTFLAQPRDIAAVAHFTGQNPDRVRDILAALVATGVVSPEPDGRYRWTAPADAVDKVANARLVARQAAEVVRTGSATATPADALIVAHAFGFRAGDDARARVETLFRPMPEMWEAIREGRLLDVGSGVGGFVLTVATMLPDMHATALEAVAAVAAVAAERAKLLGLDDRVEVLCRDARTFQATQPYDAAFWAQPFFPGPTRAGTLAMIRRSLRPGGLLLIQELEAPPADESLSPGFTVRRLVAHARGIPFARPIEELVAECEAAGFGPSRVIETGFGRVALLRS